MHPLLVVRLTLQFMFFFRPSSFPLNEDETSHGTTLSFLKPSTPHHALSAIEQLPFETIVNIASLHRPAQLADREELEDPVLDVFEPVVVFF